MIAEQVWLASRGFRVIRFRNQALDEEIDRIVEEIRGALEFEGQPPPRPSPPRGGSRTGVSSAASGSMHGATVGGTHRRTGRLLGAAAAPDPSRLKKLGRKLPSSYTAATRANVNQQLFRIWRYFAEDPDRDLFVANVDKINWGEQSPSNCQTWRAIAPDRELVLRPDGDAHETGFLHRSSCFRRGL